MRALSTATSGMSAQQLNVEVISNNIANMSTTGYKRQRAEFQDLLYQNIVRMGTQSSSTGTVVPTGIQIGTGVKTGSTYRIMEQGSLMTTGNTYDVAIDGKGFLQILLPSGETAYTRDGSLAINDQGQLVNAEGYLVQPAITIPTDATDVTISKDGLVQVKQAGQINTTTVGQLQLANFANPAGLEAIGNNMLLESGSSGAPNVASPGDIGFGTLRQGYTEASNVDSVTEVTALITAQRAYEMNSKVIKAADEMLQTTSQLKS
jgi:flagellar basal-body rod protein FlgG